MCGRIIQAKGFKDLVYCYAVDLFFIIKTKQIPWSWEKAFTKTMLSKKVIYGHGSYLGYGVTLKAIKTLVGSS